MNRAARIAASKNAETRRRRAARRQLRAAIRAWLRELAHENPVSFLALLGDVMLSPDEEKQYDTTKQPRAKLLQRRA